MSAGKPAARARGSLIGEVLDKYEIIEQVGEGGMATVYRGRHVTLGREVAIKVLHPHLSASERNRSRFAREARAIEHLEHDNVLRIFDYSGTETRDCYIVTEFVDGVTLQQLVSRHGRLPPEVVALIARELADALGYAHQLGIIHRDLKPENVMVRRDGVVKLMDFGIARFLDEMNLTVTGALVGSPAYMSPEQAMERVLDSRSDLFSLGTLLFHTVTGEMPFSGSNPSIVLRNIIEGNRPEVLELAPDASGALASLIERLLERSPDDRPDSCIEVRSIAEQSLSEVAIDPTSTEWSIRTWLIDPEGYQERLDNHLKVVLLDMGRRRLADKDHLGALRLFNRLLAIDEDNPEVLSLVQGMHRASPAQSNRRWGLAAVGGAILASLLTWVLWPAPSGVETDTEPLPTGAAPFERTPDGPTEFSSASDVPAGATQDNPPVDAVATGGPAVGQGAVSKAVSKSGKGRKTVVPPPPPPPRERVSRPAEPPVPGTVSVLVDGAWAWISLDGERVGKTGQVGRIELEPGKHTLLLENDYSSPWERSFEVSPGEHRSFEVKLTVLPATIAFPSSMGSDCEVRLNGDARGMLGELGHRLRITNPRRKYTLQVQCPGGETHSEELGMLTPGSTVKVSWP